MNGSGGPASVDFTRPGPRLAQRIDRDEGRLAGEAPAADRESRARRVRAGEVPGSTPASAVFTTTKLVADRAQLAGHDDVPAARGLAVRVDDGDGLVGVEDRDQAISSPAAGSGGGEVTKDAGRALYSARPGAPDAGRVSRRAPRSAVRPGASGRRRACRTCRMGPKPAAVSSRSRTCVSRSSCARPVDAPAQHRLAQVAVFAAPAGRPQTAAGWRPARRRPAPCQ